MVKKEPTTPSGATVYWAYGGSIFGAFAWILRITYSSNLWLPFGVTLGYGILLFLLLSRATVRGKISQWRGFVILCFALATYVLAFINLQWPMLQDHIGLSQMTTNILTLVAFLAALGLVRLMKNAGVRR